MPIANHRFTIITFLAVVTYQDVKQIVKEINGEFRSYELSCILGASGSGKSTMLNVLSGYTTNNFSGVIKVNGSVSNQKFIRWKSSYIMQENILNGFLTVNETMSFAMNLKVGSRRECKVR